jgi:predicted permease
MSGMWTDLQYAAKSLARTPGVTLALVLTIALGIGSNAAVAGFVRGLVTRDLPIPSIDTVVSLFAREARDGSGPMSYDGYLSLKAQHEPFALLGAVRESQSTLVANGRPAVVSVAAVTPDVAAILDLPLADGIVISHRAWQEQFGGRPDLRGAMIRVDALEHRVAAVAPDWLDGLYMGRAVDVWLPLAERSLQAAERSSRTFWAIGRLRPGISRDRAEAAINVNRSGDDVIALLPYDGTTPEVSGGMVRMRTLLPIAAGAVFFTACVNVATFLLSRASARTRETSVRVALGAGRRQLAKQLLADGIVITAAGGAFGLLFAMWTASIVPALFFEHDAEQLVFAPDVAGTLRAAASCAAIIVACGLIPIFEMRHDRPAVVLGRESVGASKGLRRLRNGLIAAQMMCCCLLLISAGLLLDAFRSAVQTSAGRQLGTALIATLSAAARFVRPDLGVQFFRAAEEAALSVPEVSSIAWTATPPGNRPVWQSLRIEPPRLPLADAVMDVVAFTPKSLDLVALPPAQGRMFGGADTPQSCRVAIVNQEAAAHVFGGNALGRSIEDPAGQHVEIIGVVASRARRSGTKDGTPNPPAIYYYAGQTETPLGQIGPAQFRIPANRQSSAVLAVNIVSSSYFDTVGMATVAGGVFSADPARTACAVGVVNEEAAELYFGGNAVGGAVIDDAGRRTEIVGVVRTALLRASQRSDEPTLYLPMTNHYLPRMTMILKARAADAAAVASVQRRLDSVPGGGATVLTLDAYLDKTALAPQRIATTLVSAAAATALALGVLGVGGAMADAARRQRREFAVRIALGAPGWRVVRQVLWHGMRLAGAGTVAGMLGSLLVARWLARITPGAGWPAAWLWLAPPLLLAAAVIVASVLPARRALAVDPLTIMRDE